MNTGKDIEPIDTNEYCMNQTMAEDKGVKMVIEKLNEVIDYINSVEEHKAKARKILDA